MATEVYLPVVEQTSMARLDDCGAVKDDKSSLFRSIPPERVGLSGEYDHSGLAKRVMLAFQAQLDVAETARIQVIQRGRVVILFGMVTGQPLLEQLVTIALSVSGTDAVEIYGVEVCSSAQIELASLSF
jgi:osmotically-inducible protein OsmY